MGDECASMVRSGTIPDVRAVGESITAQWLF